MTAVSQADADSRNLVISYCELKLLIGYIIGDRLLINIHNV